MAVKILIVEDNPVARSFLCRVVRESFSDTIVITEAGDLETARRHVATQSGQSAVAPNDPFKLVLVDLELPDGNGLELLAELARYPATKIVTTLYSDDDHLFPALQCGADGYLLKGIALEEKRNWELGGCSLYFRDPDRHLLELATPGVWSIY